MSVLYCNCIKNEGNNLSPHNLEVSNKIVLKHKNEPLLNFEEKPAVND